MGKTPALKFSEIPSSFKDEAAKLGDTLRIQWLGHDFSMVTWPRVWNVGNLSEKSIFLLAVYFNNLFGKEIHFHLAIMCDGNFLASYVQNG